MLAHFSEPTCPNGEFSSTDSHRLIPGTGTGTKYSVEAACCLLPVACCKRHGLPFFLKGHPVTSCRKNPQIMSISVCHTFSSFVSSVIKNEPISSIHQWTRFGRLSGQR
ncbi:hypothetical protein OIU74_009073 [Salix koriyanagi]|uniref:Uncharacterized protein n=1 Tax=Salix koriyanagi TaxID=2511006 RepID=A0A9Q0TRJ3_9ROSI|nr:hypothetical protein OIU74_009073 [Salix koriyanagi]